MRIEGGLSIAGIMAIVISYILLLLAFIVVEEQRMLYIIGGFAGFLLGLLLLAFAKIIHLQTEMLKQLETLVRFDRAQTKALTELSTNNTTATPVKKTAPAAQIKPVPSLNDSSAQKG